MKQLILTDRADFAAIRNLGGLYVDKTKYMYDCIGKGTYFFLARPRRFGKSLLCSTLKELFSANRAVFKGLWIDTSDWEWHKHPVIHLSMITMAGENNSASDFKEKLRVSLNKIAENYEVELSASSNIDLVFTLLVEALAKKAGRGVVIIIDEYDKPILDLINKPKEQKEVHAQLRSFYGVLKSLESSLRFVFLTGVYKFTQTSIFSNLNNITDLTFSLQAGALVGYTQEEVEVNFSEEIDALAFKEKLTRSAMIEKLRSFFNGYHFGVDRSSGQLSVGVYNPFGMNHTFAATEIVKKWFSSGSPTFLIRRFNYEVHNLNPSQFDVKTLHLVFYIQAFFSDDY